MLESRVPSPLVMQEMDKTRRRELVEVMRNERLARQSGQLSLVCRFLVRVGDLLIAAGERLRARYVPTVQPVPEACSVEC